MYPSTKFQSIWGTDFETKFAPKNKTDNNFEKINIKVVIGIQQCTPLRNFNHSVELQIMGPNLPQKNMNNKSSEKINMKIEISI